MSKIDEIFPMPKVSLRTSFRRWRKSIASRYSDRGLLAAVIEIIEDCTPFGLAYKIERLWSKFRHWRMRMDRVKCRYLASTDWHEPSDVVPHAMFECLCNYVENGMKDCDWSDQKDTATLSDGTEITWCELEKTILKLYRWWTEEYVNREKNHPYETMGLHKMNIGWKTVESAWDADGDPTMYTMVNGPEEEIEAKRKIFDAAQEYETRMARELCENMIMLCRIHTALWT